MWFLWHFLVRTWVMTWMWCSHGISFSVVSFFPQQYLTGSALLHSYMVIDMLYQSPWGRHEELTFHIEVLDQLLSKSKNKNRMKLEYYAIFMHHNKVVHKLCISCACSCMFESGIQTCFESAAGAQYSLLLRTAANHHAAGIPLNISRTLWLSVIILKANRIHIPGLYFTVHYISTLCSYGSSTMRQM